MIETVNLEVLVLLTFIIIPAWVLAVLRGWQ